MEYDVVVDVKLDLLSFNIKRKVCNVLDIIFIFILNDERKTHNMFALMLNPRYKNLKIVSFF
jgi:hypothetical protein